ncbi:MAG: class I SAM-dependent methyltransferase [Gammaproteobacteria bacterium]
MIASEFKDHFSGHAAAYADARPRYPVELFQWLASLTAQHALAWDCGTGNGQAALGLAEHFNKVIATDPSQEQITQAFPHARVEYRVAAAPQLNPRCVDLVTVAQALHWFDRPKFYAQLERVLKPDGAIVAWCYGECSITPAIDAAVRDFYHGTVGPYWPPERRLIDDAYRTLEFPFREITPPVFNMRQPWDLAQFLAYLDTWSAVQRYIRQNGHDPVMKLGDTLRRVWGASDSQRTVNWPLHVRAGRIHA